MSDPQGNREGRRPIGLAVGAAVIVLVTAAVVLVRDSDHDSVASARSPLFDDVDEVVPSPLPAGWARCSGGPSNVEGAEETWWSQRFGPVSEGTCRPLVTVTQMPVGVGSESSWSAPSDATDAKVGRADVAEWSDPDIGSRSMFTWAIDQNMLVEACCDDEARRHLADLVAASLHGVRERAPAHCSTPESDLDREELITNLLGKGRRLIDGDGCPIRTDVASLTPADPTHHCWPGVSFATIGTPFGSTPADDDPDDEGRAYVRDPDDELQPNDVAGRLDRDASLPMSASSTGWSRDGWTMWVDESDRDVLYLVDDAGGVEAWPRLLDGLACA